MLELSLKNFETGREADTHIVIYWELVQTKRLRLLMRSEGKARAALVKREMELRLLIRQMEIDRLSRGTVFQRLEQELHEVRQQLTAASGVSNNN